MLHMTMLGHTIDLLSFQVSEGVIGLELQLVCVLNAKLYIYKYTSILFNDNIIDFDD